MDSDCTVDLNRAPTLSCHYSGNIIPTPHQHTEKRVLKKAGVRVQEGDGERERMKTERQKAFEGSQWETNTRDPKLTLSQIECVLR